MTTPNNLGMTCVPPYLYVRILDDMSSVWLGSAVHTRYFFLFAALEIPSRVKGVHDSMELKGS